MSAAGDRYSELSEWQRSKKARISENPMIFSVTATGGGSESRRDCKWIESITKKLSRLQKNFVKT